MSLSKRDYWPLHKDYLLPALRSPMTVNILLILVLLALWGIWSELRGGLSAYISGGYVNVDKVIDSVTIDDPIDVRISKW